MWITRVSVQSGVRRHGDGGLVRAGPVRLPAAGGGADARHLLPRRLHRGAVPRRLARGGGARDRQAARGVGQRHRRRAPHHVAQHGGPGADEHRVRPRHRHVQGHAGRARPHRRGAVGLSARRQGADDLSLQQRQQPAAGQPGADVGHAQRARAVHAGRAPGGQAPAARGGCGQRRDQRPDAARGAHRPRPGAAARLRGDTGGDRHRTARGQCRPAGRPAQGRHAGHPAARRGRGARPAAVRAAGGGPPQRPAAHPGRPRAAGRARARSRFDGAHQRPAGHQLQRLQAAGRQHRGRRRRGQEGGGGDPQDAAAGRQAGPDLRLQRLGQGVAGRPAAHADRRRAADGGHRLPVPAPGAAPSSPG
jgi:hypothetical protein